MRGINKIYGLGFPDLPIGHGLDGNREIYTI